MRPYTSGEGSSGCLVYAWHGRCVDMHHPRHLAPRGPRTHPTPHPRPPADPSSCGPQIYRLFGVLVHWGNSVHSGHYYAYVHAPNALWYRCDDCHVAPCDARQALSQKAYLLFYLRESAGVEPATGGGTAAGERHGAKNRPGGDGAANGTASRARASQPQPASASAPSQTQSRAPHPPRPSTPAAAPTRTPLTPATLTPGTLAPPRSAPAGPARTAALCTASRPSPSPAPVPTPSQAGPSHRHASHPPPTQGVGVAAGVGVEASGAAEGHLWDRALRGPSPSGGGGDGGRGEGRRGWVGGARR